MGKKFVSSKRIRLVLNALDKHFAFKDWSFTILKDVRGKSVLSLCWRLVRPHKTVIFRLLSCPLSSVPAWAYYCVIYRYQKAKELAKNG